MLRNINISLRCGDLLVIVGKVGSGKTSLLCSILSETVLKKGRSIVKGRIAYVEQEPFIFSGTVEENITFGMSFN